MLKNINFWNFWKLNYFLIGIALLELKVPLDSEWPVPVALNLSHVRVSGRELSCSDPMKALLKIAPQHPMLKEIGWSGSQSQSITQCGGVKSELEGRGGME